MGINQAKAWAKVASALVQVFGLDLDGMSQFFGLEDWEEKLEDLVNSSFIDAVVSQAMQRWGESETRDKQ